MIDLAKINGEFARLDTALRGGQLDLARFRAERRKVLLDFDERASTTTPGATLGSETTRVDPPFELAPAPVASDATSTERSSPPMGMWALGVAALFVLGLSVWWSLKDQAPSAEAAPVTVTAVASAPAPAPAAPTATELPQDVANALVQSAWTNADLSSFLQRWSRLSPESVRAATDDPRIWLLRGQTGERLRDARETESVSSSQATQARTRQLEQVQAAIR